MSIARNRRSLLKSAVAASISSIALPMINFDRYQVFAESERRYSARAIDLIQRSLVIDMLGAISLDSRPEAFALPVTEEEIAMFRSSGISVFHDAMGLGGPNAVEKVLTFLAGWQGHAGRNSGLFSLVGRVEDLDQAKAQRKIAVIMGVQNADHFHEPSDVKKFYQLGQRCSQLTYNSQNRIGSGATDRVDGGISDFGVEIIKAMNQVGMLVDVSHCGERTTLDAIELSTAPIAITHSNCRALNDHPRLKSDEAIRKLAAKGGVMGVTGMRNFVRDREPTTIEHLADHIDHIVRLVGVEHAGIGSDADLQGYDDMDKEQRESLRGGYKSTYAFRDKMDTDGFDHPQKIFDLTEVLIRRGYSDQNIVAILGGNFRRLLANVWK